MRAALLVVFAAAVAVLFAGGLMVVADEFATGLQQRTCTAAGAGACPTGGHP